MAKRATTLETIFEQLEFIKEKIISIEKHILDIDSILTEDDYTALAEYRSEKAEGKLTTHEQLKTDLKL